MRGMTRRPVGFSLTEVLLSLMILACLSVLMVGSVPAAIFGLRAAEQQVAASGVARGGLERLKARGFGALPTGANQPLGVVTLDGVDYTIQADVQALPVSGTPPASAPPAPWLKRVTVTVTWKGRSGERRYTLSQVLSRVP